MTHSHQGLQLGVPGLGGESAAAEIRVVVGATEVADGGSYNAGTVDEGTTQEITVTVHNDGESVLNVANPTASGHLSVGTFSDTTIDPGDSAIFTVTLNTAFGNSSGAFEFTSDDLDESPYNVTINFVVNRVRLLYDTFSSGGLGTPRTSDVGFLRAAIGNDAGSVADGLLKVNGTPGNAQGVISSDNAGIALAYARSVGRAFIWTVKNRATLASNLKFGLSDSSFTGGDIAVGFDYGGGLSSIRALSGTNVLDTFNIGSGDHSFAAIMRSTGGWLLDTVNQKLLWQYDLNSNALYAKMVVGAILLQYDTDEWAVRDLVESYWQNDGIAALNQSNPAVDTDYTGNAGGHYTLYYTLPGSPASGDKIELRYRVSDSTYWTAYITYTGTQWNFKLDSVNGGTSNQVTVTNVGVTNAIRVITDGNVHKCYTRNTSDVWTRRGGDISEALNASATTLRIATVGGWTLSKLMSVPTNDSRYGVSA